MKRRANLFGFLAVWLAFLDLSAGAAEIGDAENGAKLWRQCRSCHDIGAAARNRTGPHLNDVFGRRAGGVEGFTYSKAMARVGADGLHWTLETLDLYIENPKSLVSKTRMNFGGVADPAERADLLAFLRAYSDNPRDIPESAPTAYPSDPEVDPAILALQGDPAYGEYLSSECVTCHRRDGADKGIPSITGWTVEDFATAMHAYKTKARPHPVMQMMAARLSDEEIAALAAYFADIE